MVFSDVTLIRVVLDILNLLLRLLGPEQNFYCRESPFCHLDINNVNYSSFAVQMYKQITFIVYEKKTILFLKFAIDLLRTVFFRADSF